MAGKGHYALKHDPAIERWYQMREDMYKHFRVTKRAARTGIVLMVVIPGLVGLLTVNQNMKWDWRGKRKGQSLRSGSVDEI